MATVNTVGNGYYNYYNVKSRMDTTDGKAVTVWYERDLSKEEICNDFNTAIDNYNKYLIKKQDASDRDKVNEKINSLNEELQKYGKEPVGEN